MDGVIDGYWAISERGNSVGICSIDIIFELGTSGSSIIFDNDLRVLLFDGFIFAILLVIDLYDFDFDFDFDFEFADVMVFREFVIVERDFTEVRGIVERLRLYRII